MWLWPNLSFAPSCCWVFLPDQTRQDSCRMSGTVTEGGLGPGGQHRAPLARMSRTRRLLLSLCSPPALRPPSASRPAPLHAHAPSLQGASRTQLRLGTASAVAPVPRGPRSGLDTVPAQAGLSVAFGFPVTPPRV